ncbi:MAG: hypothetical protein Kow0077_06560 [Anaerolineae bacterium]
MKKLLWLLLAVILFPSAAIPARAQGNSPILQATVVFGTIIVREGPGLDFAQIGQAAQGETLPVTGRNSDSTWFEVQLPDGTPGWVADYVVSLDGSPASLPIIEVERPVSDTLYVPPGCDYFGIGPFYGTTGQSIVLTQGWEAATRELLDEYLTNVIQIVRFDGRLISTYSAYRGEPFYNEATDTWRIFWSFNMGPVAAGEHRIEWTQMYNTPISDGLDGNNDGQPDTYGPDPFSAGCTLIIE